MAADRRPTTELKYGLAGTGTFQGIRPRDLPKPQGPSALVVDDDGDMVRLIGTVLAAAGFNTIPAYDALQGFVVAQREQPTVVVVDLNMPAGGGMSLLEKLRKSPKTESIPVVVLTANSDPALPERAKALGAQGFLLKPVDPVKLMEAVRPFAG